MASASININTLASSREVQGQTFAIFINVKFLNRAEREKLNEYYKQN